MKMKGLASKILAGTMAFLMTFSGVQFSLPMVANAADSYVVDYRAGAALNDWMAYITDNVGIASFTNMDMAAHTNSNFFTKDLTTCGINSGTGGGAVRDAANAPETTYIKKISAAGINVNVMAESDDYVYYGKDYRLYIKDNAEAYLNLVGQPDEMKDNFKITIPKKENILFDTATKEYIDLDQMQIDAIEYNKGLTSYSAKASSSESNATKDFKDNNKRSINCGTGLSYVNLSYSDLNPATNIVFRFNSIGPDNNDTCIVNIDCKGYSKETPLSISSPLYIGEQGSEEKIACAEANFNHNYNKVIFNFYDSSKADNVFTGKILVDAVGLGTIIAPAARVETGHNWDGVIIADSVRIGGEFHRVGRSTMPPVPTTPGTEPTEDLFNASISLTKSFSDKSIDTLKSMSDDDRNNFLKDFKFTLYSDEACTNVVPGTQERSVTWGSIDNKSYNAMVTFVPNVTIPRNESVTYYIKETAHSAKYEEPAASEKYKVVVTNNSKGSVSAFDVVYYDKDGNKTGGNTLLAGKQVANCENVKKPVYKDITISKVAVVGQSELVDASLKLEAKSGTTTKFDTLTVNGGNDVIKSETSITWKTSATKLEIKNLPEGSYILTETAAPQGYKVASVIEFTIDSDGNVTTTETSCKSTPEQKAAGIIVMLDEAMPNVTISKKALNGQDELPDATLKLESNTTGVDFSKLTVTGGSEVAKTASAITWKTAATAVTVEKLPAGSYILTETDAPGGYDIASKIEFTVKPDGSIVDVTGSAESISASKASEHLIVMIDKLLPIKKDIVISKKEINGTDELSGASLTLVAKAGTVVDFTKIVTQSEDSSINPFIHSDYISWETGTKSLMFKALPEGTYILKETAAPQGNLIAETNIEFTINSDGTVSVSSQSASCGSTSSELEQGTIVMLDGVMPNVKISKKALNGQDELPDAKLKLEAQPGTNVDFKKINRVSGGNNFDNTTSSDYITWESGNGQLEIEKLPAGSYILSETKAPNGYAIASIIKFTVKPDGTIVMDSQSASALDPVDKHLIVMIDNLKASAITIVKHSFKTDADNNIIENPTEIKDIKLSVYLAGSDGKPVAGSTAIETWTTQTGSHEISGEKLAVNQKYVLVEEETKKGYAFSKPIVFTINENDEVIIDGNKVDSRKIKMLDREIKDIYVNKVKIGQDGEGTEPLADAELYLYEGALKPEDVKISTDPYIWYNGGQATDHISGGGLEVGKTYTLRELSAPGGFKIASDIIFEIQNDGTIKQISTNAYPIEEKNDRFVIVMLDDAEPKPVKISKKNLLTDQTELTGAHIIVYDKADTTSVIDEWDTESEVHTIAADKLTIGKTYVLEETGAPKGYLITSKIEFTINADGTTKVLTTGVDSSTDSSNVTTITMLDDAFASINITKVAVGGNEEIPGAKLTLHEGTKDGAVVETWISGKDADGKTVTTPHTIENTKLKAGTTYVLVEELAPLGYAIASNITFTIDENGNVTGLGTEAYDAQTRTVTMLDAPIVVKMSKKELSKTEELPGATLELTTTSDVDLTKVVVSGGATGVDKQAKTITWKSGTSETIFTKLPAGDYSYVEKATPDNSKYEVATTITFTVGTDGKITNLKNAASTSSTDNNIVVMEDALKVKTVTFSKRVVSKTDELAGATLKLESKTTGVDLSKLTVTGGSEVAKTAKAITWKTATTAVTVEKLPAGSYTLTETAAPKGFAIATVITFDVDANGTVTNVKNAAKATDLTNPLHAYIVMEDTPVGTFQFSKENLGGHLIKGAKLQVVPVDGQDLSTVTVLGTSGYTADEVTITKDSITWVSKYKPLGLVAVPDGKYKLVEVDVPVGYAKAEPLIFEAKDGILTKGGANGAVELTDLYDPNTTTVSVYSRYYNVETFDPKHEDIIESDTPTADNTQFTLFDENGKEAKIVKKIVKREEIDDGVWVTIVTFVIDTTEWTPGTNRTYTIKETIAPTAKENGGYFADDEQMVTTYTIMKKVGSDGNTTYDRTWSNKYGKNVVYNEFDPKYIPLYSHTKTKGASTNKTPDSPVPTPPSTETSTSKKRSPKTGETAIPFVLFGGAMSALVAGAVWYTINLKKREEE